MPTCIVSLYQFNLPAPFSAGHPLSDGEAAALNNLLLDLTRMRLSDWISQISSKDEILSPEQLSSLQHRASRYVEQYKFDPVLSRPRKSVLQQEREIVAAELSQSEDDPTVEVEARRRILARRSAIDPLQLGI